MHPNVGLVSIFDLRLASQAGIFNDSVFHLPYLARICVRAALRFQSNLTQLFWGTGVQGVGILFYLLYETYFVPFE